LNPSADGNLLIRRLTETKSHTKEEKKMERDSAHHVKIYKTTIEGQEGEVWKVRPGVLKARPRDTITWHPEETDITIYFPTGEVFLVDQLAVSSGQERLLSVKLDAEPGEYRYAVFCHSGDDFAVGSTHPIIIIERGD
jgi:plastocyanin